MIIHNAGILQGIHTGDATTWRAWLWGSFLPTSQLQLSWLTASPARLFPLQHSSSSRRRTSFVLTLPRSRYDDSYHPSLSYRWLFFFWFGFWFRLLLRGVFTSLSWVGSLPRSLWILEERRSQIRVPAAHFSLPTCSLIQGLVFLFLCPPAVPPLPPIREKEKQKKKKKRKSRRPGFFFWRTRKTSEGEGSQEGEKQRGKKKEKKIN